MLKLLYILSTLFFVACRYVQCNLAILTTPTPSHYRFHVIVITARESVDLFSDSDSQLRLPSFSDSRFSHSKNPPTPDSSSRQCFKMSDSRLRLPKFSDSRLPTPYHQNSTDSRLPSPDRYVPQNKQNTKIDALSKCKKTNLICE